MQLYDFKKNRKIIKKELELILNKNKEIIEYILHEYKKDYNRDTKEVYGKDKELYEIDKFKDNFTYVFNKTIGTKSLNSKNIYKNISNINLNYNKFQDCEFNQVKFENCTFFGTSFNNCKFNNVIFSSCNFEDERGIAVLFDNNCILNNCIFDKTNLKNTIFRNSKLIFTKAILSSLRNIIFYQCHIEHITFSDCDLKALKIMESEIKFFYFEDEYLSKVDENTFIDILKNDTKDEETYKNMFKDYKNISTVFEKNRLFSYSGEYYYLAKCSERKYLKGLEKLKSNIFYYICGYGERPTFALISSLEIVLIFSIIYMFSGLCINERIIHYNINILYYLPRKLLYMDLIDCFYFSLVTFTSVGYGDIFPIGYSVIFSCIEMILGVTMVGVWTATLARKITR